MRFFLLMVLCGFLGTGHTQVFDRVYDDSATLALAQPLQWVAVPKNSVDTPDVFAATETWDFQPYTPTTVLPTSDKQDVWARFALPITETPQTWFIRLPGQSIFRVSLFSQKSQGGWRIQSAGHAIAPADWTLRTRVPSFELLTHSDQVQTYYMRFEQRRAITDRPPMLLTPIEYVNGASRVGVVMGLMWGMFSVLAMLCLGAFAMARNQVFVWLGAVVMTLMFTQLVLIGYGSWRVWPHSAYLNQIMGWVSSALSMAAGAWFCTQATYAKSGHPFIHRLLLVVVVGSLLMAGLMLINQNLLPSPVRNLWMALATFALMGSLVWMSLRGQAWNRLLLLGAAPIGLATLARVAYNAGWVSNVEVAQVAGVLSAILGLLWIFLVLAWRSRAALFSNHRGAALTTYDPASGLMLPRIVERRLPQILTQAQRRGAECGVLLLRWLDQAPSHDAVADEKRGAALSRLGEILRRAVRDMDTVVRYDENHFMLLVEGPVNRNALSEVSTKLLADCIRAADKTGDPHAFHLHIAIWHGRPGRYTAQDVIDKLKARLHKMASGTKRLVQFVDAANEAASAPAEEDHQRREELLAKINAIEISHPALTSEQLQGPETQRP
ncbi:7TM diverse intracellular signaling domain-containing protein [Polaromonas sp. UC242_47]|uniref:sensor domain-containing diguanylate cyclase n=1 Tax=Polaromonas sp. UC242_47 TaxID=3374626 RepID=UPI0037B1C4E2